MTVTNSGGLHNLMRLASLKNVSGRRKVLPGAQFMEDLENYEPDVSGASAPEMNMPIPDTGEDFAPQSYDVRANQIQEPPSEMGQEMTPDFYQNLGRSLASYVQPDLKEENQNLPSANADMAYEDRMQLPKPVTPEAPPIETAQVDMQEGLPPVTASQQVNAQEEGLAQPPLEEQEEKEPGTYVELGAAQKLYQDPNLPPETKAEIERIFDISLTPERMKEVNEFEKVVDAFVNKLNGVETALTAREKNLLAKVENRDLSTSEQISMVLALVAPAILGALFAGKAGFVGGLAEGGKNIVGSLAGRQKEIREAEELLPELALEKSKIAKEKLATTQQAAEIKRKIQESVPNYALRQLFTKDGMLVNGKLVLNTGNPLLPLKSQSVRSEKDFERFREKTMPELAEKLSTTEQGLHLLDNLRALTDISDSQKEGLQYDYIPFYDSISNSFKALVPASRDTFVDEEGNTVKISELYESTLEQLSDMYSQAVGAAGSKTAFKTYREHFREMLPNPYTFESLRKGRTGLGTLRSQINSVKDKFEDNMIKKLDAAGVETSPVKELFSRTEINTNRSEKDRRNKRAQEAVNQVLGK